MRKRRTATIATVASLASAMVVTVASAGVTVTQVQPDFGGLGSGAQWGGVLGAGTVLYDNTAGPGTLGSFDWTNPAYSWVDDIHFAPNPAGYIITGIFYSYFNTGSLGPTVTHTIEVYDMTSPTDGFTSSGGFLPILNLGPLAGSTVVPGLVGSGTVIGVSVTGLSITVGSGAWISFQEAVPSPTFAGPTFWLSGGTPSTGLSHDTLGAFDPGAGFYSQNQHVLAPYSNMMIAVTGKKVPGPSVIALLGLSGLATLSRRRRK